jgi:ABC-type transport system substrate-binding protein
MPGHAFAQEAPRRGGVMTVHFATEQRILNPSLQASTGVYLVGGKIQEPLVDLDAEGNPAPCLAESWESSRMARPSPSACAATSPGMMGVPSPPPTCSSRRWRCGRRS